MPGPLPSGSEESTAVLSIAQERVRMSGDVDLNGRGRVPLVEEQQSLLDVLLPDVSVRSLRASDVVRFHPDPLLTRCCASGAEL